VRQPQVAALYSGGSAENMIRAYNTYIKDMSTICADVTKAYLEAGWDPARTGQEVLRFDFFTVQNPLLWYTRTYDIIHDASTSTSPFSTPVRKTQAITY
jgi:hypothetical protein